MNLRIGYFLREAFTYLARNPGLAVASSLTVMIAFSLGAWSYLLSQGVDNATVQWRGGIEFIVYMEPTATDQQVRFVADQLDEEPEVERYAYLDHQAAYEEFQRLFDDDPVLLDSVTPEILPPSYRINPRTDDPEIIDAIGARFAQHPGVREVVFAKDVIEQFVDVTNRGRVFSLVVAGAVLVVAVILIYNTIRMALYARRREVEVMKLVGASNWFVRVPFMLEGLLQAVIGLAIGVPLTLWGVRWFRGWVGSGKGQLLQQIDVSTGEVLATLVLLVLAALLFSASSAALAVSRYLDR